MTISGKTVVIHDAKVRKADVLASNGVMHLIDTVLRPPDLKPPTQEPAAITRKSPLSICA